MSVEGNKALIRRLIEQVFNAHDLGGIDGFFMGDYVEHVPIPPGLPSGLAGLKAFWSSLFAAFPDFRYTIDDMVAEGDRVAARLTAHGTHQGPFLGVPATGKQVSWTEIHIGRCDDGTLAEHWATLDQVGLLQQLGAVPAPGQGPPTAS